MLGSEREREATMDGLRAARGVIQRALGAQLQIKRTPTLSFVYDESVERADRLNRLMDS